MNLQSSDEKLLWVLLIYIILTHQKKNILSSPKISTLSNPRWWAVALFFWVFAICNEHKSHVHILVNKKKTHVCQWAQAQMQPSLIEKAKDLVRLWVQDSSDACLINKTLKKKKKVTIIP